MYVGESDIVRRGKRYFMQGNVMLVGGDCDIVGECDIVATGM